MSDAPKDDELEKALASPQLDREALRVLLAARSPEHMTRLQKAGEAALFANFGRRVHLRGLIEFSNRCVCDCRYCGIRRSNRHPHRYTLTLDEMLDSARWAAERGYGSVVLQSGERRDEKFVAFVCESVSAIKAATRSARLPEGLAVTLCVGEQSRETYARFKAAGAHRYLLRIETSSPELFARIHPPEQRFEDRLACLHALRELGFMVGSGVMIGLPGQRLDQLVDDLLFFQAMGLDMIGMGPYLPHDEARLPGDETLMPAMARFALSLRMIAASRLLLGDVNIASTTALQAIAPDGREQGLCFGANVIMPQTTPLRVRRDYTLYEGKPCLDDSAGQCAACLEGRLRSIGREVARDDWGDSPHFRRKLN